MIFMQAGNFFFSETLTLLDRGFSHPMYVCVCDHRSAAFPLRCATTQLRSTSRQFARCYFILAHLQHSKFNTVYI